MSDYDVTRIRKRPAYYSETVPVYQHANLIGFDSEADTRTGRPMMFQFSLPNQDEDETLLKIIPNKKYGGLEVFTSVLDEYCTNGDKYRIYLWNISYEFTQLFQDLPDFVKVETHISLHTSNGWTIKISNTKRPILDFIKPRKNGKDIRTAIRIVDGYAFYKASLKDVANMLALGHKYETKGTARENFTRADLEDEEFLKYARRDAYITRLIGQHIESLHQAENIPITVSSPHFAQSVFVSNFLGNKKSVRAVPPNLEQAGLYSYHGGKNGFYLPGPAKIIPCWQYDITSAYPEAMRQLPDLTESNWSKSKEYIPGAHALWFIEGSYENCGFNGIQYYYGPWVPSGHINYTWITGYELDVLIERGEFTPDRILGYIYDGPQGGPLAKYVDTYFKQKATSTGPARETAKLLLNSLYGKFFQKVPLGNVGTYDMDTNRWATTDPNEDYDYDAGLLYHPAIASLITGYVRAKIHRIEHKYQSVMTSTDGIFGTVPPDNADLGKYLGGLTVLEGSLRIWRERLYVFDYMEAGLPKKKYALHGFRGSLAKLEQIPLEKGEYNYTAKQVMTLKMSTKKSGGTQYGAGYFAELPYTLVL